MTEPQPLEHYTRQSSGTVAIGDSALTRLRAKLATMPRVDGQGTELRDPAEALLADAINTAEAINRDAAGRFAAVEPETPPRRLSTGTSGLSPAEAQARTPLDRIRAQAQRQYDDHLPAGYLPPAS